MSRGMTIAEFVQQVYYAIYKVRLDVTSGTDGAFHSKSDKFKEVVMEGNFVLQELQKEQDWNWLRDRWEMGIAHNHRHSIQEFTLPDDVYKPCSGYNDGVRLHLHRHVMPIRNIPWTSPRSGNKPVTEMYGPDMQSGYQHTPLMAFQVGDAITFTRPWLGMERGCLVETDVIRLLPQLHICTDECDDNCPLAYEQKVFTEIPDPYYMVVRTAAKRAEGDPSVAERVQSLTDEGTKLLSAMRENDSAHNTTDTWEAADLSYIEVL